MEKTEKRKRDGPCPDREWWTVADYESILPLNQHIFSFFIEAAIDKFLAGGCYCKSCTNVS
jgi:hypothetical protein